MELTRRNTLVYVCLAALWLLVTGWQIEEHLRVRAAAQTELRNRAKAIARTMSASIRGMRFRGTVRQEQLEPLLNELAAGGAVERIVCLVDIVGHCADLDHTANAGHCWGGLQHRLVDDEVGRKRCRREEQSGESSESELHEGDHIQKEYDRELYLFARLRKSRCPAHNW